MLSTPFLLHALCSVLSGISVFALMLFCTVVPLVGVCLGGGSPKRQTEGGYVYFTVGHVASVLYMLPQVTDLLKARNALSAVVGSMLGLPYVSVW